jgi:voltage-gated sodium channel
MEKHCGKEASMTLPGNPTPDLTASQKLGIWMESSAVSSVILGVILLNAIVLGLETSDRIMANFGPMINFIDQASLTVFVVELSLKLIAFRHRFFTAPWNIFDFLIVGISFVPGSDGLTVLRALRILRVLRVISVAPSLRRVVEGFISALPGMGSVFVLMTMIFYIGAVMATRLFGETHPQWFGSIGESAYSLFQIMTLESWSMGIVRPVMEIHPYAWAFFVPFIMVTTFAVVNLLVGLIVNSMQEAASEEADHDRDVFREEVMARLEGIEKSLDELKK